MSTKSLAKIYSAELEGINARLIEIEVDINTGLHAFNIVGLPDKALNEAKERVNSALKNSGVKPPNRENRKITVNLAPADLKKNGSHYDLAIALGYLLATKQIAEFDTRDKIFLGELALDGRLRPVNGALNIAQMAVESGFHQLFLPAQNANEAAAIEGAVVVSVSRLQEAIDILEGKVTILPFRFQPLKNTSVSFPNFSEIKGQENAKRALTIAAAGAHNMIMIGSPGVGKSLIAQTLGGILPELGRREAIEVTKIWSAAGIGPGGLMASRPFRSPHQTSSQIALIGGGSDPKPGEISLAHCGVLFLDEIPEFQKATLEALRQPMESGIIHIARVRQSLVLPARFMLVAAMNPCPCGYYADPDRDCRCTAREVITYQKKISGPFLDRIDLQIKVKKIALNELRNHGGDATESAAVKMKIVAARRVQTERFKKMQAGEKLVTNADLSARQIERVVDLDASAEKFLGTLGKSYLSPRGYYRMLKVARTIADIEEGEQVNAEHLAEAFSYRLREEI
jgi:magnesium chelatase family protein